MNEEKLTNPFDTLNQKLKQYFYMTLVAVLSITALVVFPMLGNGNDIPSLNFPKTADGWMIYITLRACTTALNVMIYLSFIKQGELNSAKHPNRIEADKILLGCKNKELTPRSPAQYKAGKYGGKSLGVVASSVLALVALPPIVAYDWRMALTYLFTIIVAIVFGMYEMKDAEAYWCYEYLRYAKYIQEKESEENEKCSK